MKYFLGILLITALRAQQPMTAEDAIRIGLENNYDIRLARNNAKIAQNNTGIGAAGFLPTLDGTGSYDLSTSDLETTNPFRPGGVSDSRTGNTTISLNWTLFDGFRMFADKRRYNELARLGESLARNVIEQKTVEILRAYFNLVQQTQLLDVAKNSRDISETRLSKEKVRRDLGGASSTDFLNAQVSFNNDAALLLNQDLQVLIAQKDLNILLARDPSTAIAVSMEIVIPPLKLDLSALQNLAMERNSVLVAALHNNAVAAQNIKLARSAFFPRLFLGANYGYTDQTTTTGSDNPAFPDEINNLSKDGRIALTLSWSLFNGLRDKIVLENARLLARNRALELENIKNQIVGLVQEKYVTFQKRIELLRLEEQNSVAAEQNLQLQKERYQVGSATSLEFRDAQVNLTRAQTTLIVARYQARITGLEIEQLTGRLAIKIEDGR